jgi:hypothetical protein
MSHSQSRRKPHTRSRNGCSKCKARHVRCDQVLPIWYLPLVRVLVNPLLRSQSGNCFKYGHDCSLSEVPAFEIDMMSPNDYANKEHGESARTYALDAQHKQNGQYSQPSQYSQQTQYSTHGYESSSGRSIPYYDPLRTDLTPEAISALNCYLQVCADSGQPTEDPKYVP